MKNSTLLFLTILILLAYLLNKKSDVLGIDKISYYFQNNSQKTEEEKRKGYSELKFYDGSYLFEKIDTTLKWLKEEYTFDNEGNVLTYKEFRLNGKYNEHVSKYNEENMLTEVVYYDTNGNQYGQEFIKYNENNVITERIITRPDKEESIDLTYKYDDKGNEISCIDLRNHKLGSESYSGHKYNDKNQLIETIQITNFTENHWLGPSTDSIVTTYRYNNEGKLQSKREVSEHSRGSYYYTYNEGFFNKDKGLLQKEIADFEYGGTLEPWRRTIKYKYNQKGLIIEQGFYSNDIPYNVYIFEYK